jgi:crossover junction endodeoxyribonuclease RuvC
MIIIGIDPGLKGAIAVIESKQFIFDMPVMQTGGIKGRNELDCRGLYNILVHIDKSAVVYLENVHGMPGNGVKQAFVSGHTLGGIKAVISCLGFRLALVTAQTWKKHFGLSKDKELSRATAIRMFPEMAHYLSRKKDSDRAEALLIAQYGMEKNK